jgi:hypothetical protein
MCHSAALGGLPGFLFVILFPPHFYIKFFLYVL